MLKQRRRRQKSSSNKEESQKDLVMNVSGADIRETLDAIYGQGVVSLSITTPPTLLGWVQSQPELQKLNRSLALTWLLHQGKVRWMEMKDKC